MSDIQDIRPGIDVIDGGIFKFRARQAIIPNNGHQRLEYFWYVGGDLKGWDSGIYLDNTGAWINKEIRYAHWDDHLKLMTVDQLNTLEVIITTSTGNAEGYLIEIDTVEVEILWSVPTPISLVPEDAALGLSPKQPDYLVEYYRQIAEGTLQTSGKDADLFRQDIIRSDAYNLLLGKPTQVLNTTYYPGKASLTLAGTLEVDYGSRPAKASVSLSGKAPDDIDQTENQWITVPDSYTSHLLLSGQNVGDEDTVMPDRLRTYLSGKAPTAELSYTVSPDAVSMQVGQPPGSERLWPESWVPVWFEPGWSGDVANIDEPPDEPDGLVITANQDGAVCSVYFSDVKYIRNGIDTITGVRPSYRIRSPEVVPAPGSEKLYTYVYVEENFVTGVNLQLTNDFFTYVLPSFDWNITGTDTGPINSLYMNLIIWDPGITVEVDLLSLDVLYDYATTSKVPILGSSERPAKGTLSLQGKAVEAVNSEDASPSGSLSLVGEAPLLFRSLKLELTGKGIALDAALPVPGTALAFTGKAPIVRSIIPDAATLSLTGKRPAFVFGTVIPPGDHGIISLSTRRSIEHIATPADELEF